MRHPDDPRLTQLAGLLDSRAGRTQEAAIDLLRALERRFPRDEETMGILAGALKRQAGADVASPLLTEAQAKYAKGWAASRRENTWLGINAAATALYRGDIDAARAGAAEVHEALCAQDVVRRGPTTTCRSPTGTTSRTPRRSS